MPESVLHDAEQDVCLVSNINGLSAAKDDNRFIARVRPDGAGSPAEQRLWVASGRGGATLHAPKGMVLVGDTLWVADIDAVRGFHHRTRAPLGTVELAGQGARFLNDLVVGPDGAVYVTDTGTRYDRRNLPIAGPALLAWAARAVHVI